VFLHNYAWAWQGRQAQGVGLSLQTSFYAVADVKEAYLFRLEDLLLRMFTACQDKDSAGKRHSLKTGF
jgi:hypothetical protein